MAEYSYLKNKIIIMVSLLGICCILIFYFHARLETGRIVPYLLYIPIIPACIWWQKKGVIVAIFLSVLLILSHGSIRIESTSANDYIPAIMFILIGCVIAVLSGQIKKEEKKHIKTQGELSKQSYDLRERIKELRLLYKISQFISESDRTLDEILQRVIEFIPVSWQYPERTCARICLDKRIFTTEKFVESKWRQSSDLFVFGKKTGTIDVFCKEEMPEGNEGPFLKEERFLLDAVAERLGRLVERMLTKHEAEIHRRQLLQADKLVTLGTLVSGVAHEINNPNNFIMLNMPVIGQIFDEAILLFEKRFKAQGDFVIGKMKYSQVRNKIPHLVTGIVDGSQRIKRIVEELQNFARHDKSGFVDGVDIVDVVVSAASLIKPLIKKTTKKFSIKNDKGIPALYGNFQRLEQTIINLLKNACEALSDDTNKIEVAISYSNEKETIKVEIKDEGIGIPEEILRHVTDPFYTTRQVSGGMGLGLSVSMKIIEEHQGMIDIRSKVGHGTTVNLMLPVKSGHDYEEKEIAL